MLQHRVPHTVALHRQPGQGDTGCFSIGFLTQTGSGTRFATWRSLCEEPGVETPGVKTPLLSQCS